MLLFERYNLVYGNLLSIPTEISAICVLFNYWTKINSSVWIVATIILTVAVGFSAIRIYGEVEFWFALLKIVFIVFLIILGLVIDLGGVPGTPRIGFRYWKEPGPFVEYIATGSWGQFLGFWAVMSMRTPFLIIKTLSNQILSVQPTQSSASQALKA